MSPPPLRRPAPTLRTQLTLALVVPALAAIAALAYFADLAAREALEKALGERLSSVAQAAATLVGPRVLMLEAGDDETRLKKNALAKLEQLQEATEVARILVVRAERAEALLDTAGELTVGAEYVRARFDALELERVALGRAAASVLFASHDGLPYKTGYAPLRNEEERIAGYVAVHAPAGYTRAIDALRATLGLIALVSVGLLAAAAVASARAVAVPLTRLAEAAERIGRGELDTEVPSGGPREAVVLEDAMRSMTTSLKARDEEMQMMLAGIAHEVRNPLGGIELFGGLLREDLEAGDPRRKHVDKILRELGVLAKVVNDFLDFARKRPPERRPLELCDLLSDTLALVERDAAEKGVRVVLEAPRQLSAELDPEAMKRAILNLVRNAVQAAPKGTGQVRVVAGEAAGGRIRVAVEDNGPGIPEEKKEEIWKPFFTTKQKGTGLGLALSRKTILAHGGTLTVEDGATGGARFVIDVPAASRGEHGEHPGHR